MFFLGLAESIQLVPDGTLILHIIIILIMMFILNSTLFKPINHILEERERRTRGRSNEAQDILRRVEEKLRHYESGLREERAEGYRLLEQVRTEAMRKRQEVLNSAREEVGQLIGTEKANIDSQAEAARIVLQRDVRSLAANISAQILRRPLSKRTISEVEPRI
ncbi:MAG TPA: ATP synthase F0 subunit B [Pyrinomonadaceae bacterium]|nr:ATP synthase F0 subunit B [Pyrinomonadaceae bacterium]